MPYMLGRLKVQDYAKWKTGFESVSDMRKRAGAKAHRVFRTVGEPNALWLIMEWDSLDNARKYYASEEVREAMQKAGGLPEVYFLEEVE